jgi:hypothetical protein
MTETGIMTTISPRPLAAIDRDISDLARLGLAHTPQGMELMSGYLREREQYDDQGDLRIPDRDYPTDITTGYNQPIMDNFVHPVMDDPNQSLVDALGKVGPLAREIALSTGSDQATADIVEAVARLSVGLVVMSRTDFVAFLDILQDSFRRYAESKGTS